MTDKEKAIIMAHTEEAISIAEEFSEWLEDMAKKYKWNKDDVQALIKKFLMC